MSLSELLPTLQTLSREEKFRLVRILVSDLESEDLRSPIKAGEKYPVWSPIDAHEAGSILLGELDRSRTVS